MTTTPDQLADLDLTDLQTFLDSFDAVHRLTSTSADRDAQRQEEEALRERLAQLGGYPAVVARWRQLADASLVHNRDASFAIRFGVNRDRDRLNRELETLVARLRAGADTIEKAAAGVDDELALATGDRYRHGTRPAAEAILRALDDVIYNATPRPRAAIEAALQVDRAAAELTRLREDRGRLPREARLAIETEEREAHEEGERSRRAEAEAKRAAAEAALPAARLKVVEKAAAQREAEADARTRGESLTSRPVAARRRALITAQDAYETTLLAAGVTRPEAVEYVGGATAEGRASVLAVG